MKKNSCILLLLLLAVLPLSAANPWAVDSIKLGLGNDKWAYGLSRNDDDQLSYSEHVAIEAERWFLRMDLDGITNRGWRTGWSIYDPAVTDFNLNDFYHGRIDYALINAGLKWDVVFPRLLDIHIEPSIGVAAAGYMHFDFLQNMLHKLTHIHPVELPYDWDNGLYFYPYQSLLISNSLHIHDFEKSFLALGVDLFAEASYGFSSSEHVTGRVSLQNEASTYLSLSIGYMASQSWSASSTMELYNRYINGPFAEILINAGFISVDYYTFLSNHFGYGRFTVDVMKIFEPSTWVQSDVSYAMGFSRMLGITFNESEVGFPILDSGFSLVLKNRYVAGYPIDSAFEQGSVLSSAARLKRAFTSATVGVKYEYPLQALKKWVAPYGALSAGMAYWRQDYLFNMNYIFEEGNEDIGVPSISTNPVYNFIIDAEVGLSLMPEGFIRMGNTTLRLSVFAGAFWVVNSSSLTDPWYGYYEASELLWGCIVPRFGALASFGFDV